MTSFSKTSYYNQRYQCISSDMAQIDVVEITTEDKTGYYGI